jgi:hypothetical protein
MFCPARGAQTWSLVERFCAAQHGALPGRGISDGVVQWLIDAALVGLNASSSEME